MNRKVIAATLSVKSSVTTEKGAARADQILREARNAFAENGYAGLSMRAIAVKLDLSLGNLQHYFRSKEALVEAVLLTALDEIQTRLDDVLRDHAQAKPLDCFAAVVDMYLDLVDDVAAAGFYFQLWALASSNRAAAKMVSRQMSRIRKTIANLLRNLEEEPPDEQRLTTRAAIITSQLLGLNVYFTRSNARLGDLSRLRDEARRYILAIAVDSLARR